MDKMIIKYRQPIFTNGVFQEWHFWGANLEQGGELANVGWLTYKMGVTDPNDSLQFIGWTDKNGIEIYVGDILRVTDWSYLPNSQEKDKSQPHYNEVEVKYEFPHFILGGWLNFDLDCEYEIIGNIYQPKK